MLRHITELVARWGEQATPPPTHTPGYFVEPPPRLVTYLHRGSRLGLAAATGLGLVVGLVIALSGGLVDLLVEEMVPGLDLAITLLLCVLVGAILSVGYFGGMALGAIIYGVQRARYERAHRAGRGGA